MHSRVKYKVTGWKTGNLCKDQFVSSGVLKWKRIFAGWPNDLSRGEHVDVFKSNLILYKMFFKTERVSEREREREILNTPNVVPSILLKYLFNYTYYKNSYFMNT